jgi:Uma2 family endonuclease
MRAGQIDLLDLELPITLSPNARVSDEELMRFSRQNKPFKIERNKEGDLTIMTPVGGIGSTHEQYVTGTLFAWTGQDGRGIDFSPSVGFNLPDGSCLQPDASWVALERWNALTLKQQTGFPPLCPDFVVEVRSQSDPRRVLEAKMQTWLDNGAKLAWLVDPIAASVTIYRPGQAPQTLDRPETVKGESPVDGFELRCTRLWA